MSLGDDLRKETAEANIRNDIARKERDKRIAEEQKIKKRETLIKAAIEYQEHLAKIKSYAKSGYSCYNTKMYYYIDEFTKIFVEEMIRLAKADGIQAETTYKRETFGGYYDSSSMSYLGVSFSW